jgi:hypothetical protein
MIKGIIIGALLVVTLVGYGVLDTRTLERAGTSAKQTVNLAAQKLDEVTR